MTGADSAAGLLLLDACCVINLHATGRMEGILDSIPYDCAVATFVVEEEALGIAGVDGEIDERERIDLEPLIGAGALRAMSLSTPEEQGELVRFAALLDEGEAATCALASVHGGSVATDDRKALRLLDSEGIRTLQTPELVYEWVQRTGASVGQVREVVERVLRRASFRPRRQAPRADWWLEHLAGG